MHERHDVERNLRLRQIHLRRVFVLQRECFTLPTTPTISRIFSPLSSALKAGHDPFANDVLAREKLVREAFVHDHDRRGVEAISVVEDAALPDRDPHRFEVIGRR